MEQPENYKKNFVELYDSLMNTEYYLDWGNWINLTIEKYSIPKDKAIDLACGTGKIAEILEKLGFSVLCIDNSEEMLKKAKIRLKGRKCTFAKRDMANFDLSSDYSLVTSFYDSINYLLELEKVNHMMKNVSKALKKGGYFLLDINTKEKIKYLQKKPSFISEADSYRVQFMNEGTENFWNLKIKITDKNNKVSMEEHIERGYDLNEIVSSAKLASLELVESREEVKQIKEGKFPSRIYFVFKKI